MCVNYQSYTLLWVVIKSFNNKSWYYTLVRMSTHSYFGSGREIGFRDFRSIFQTWRQMDIPSTERKEIRHVWISGIAVFETTSSIGHDVVLKRHFCDVQQPPLATSNFAFSLNWMTSQFCPQVGKNVKLQMSTTWWPNRAISFLIKFSMIELFIIINIKMLPRFSKNFKKDFMIPDQYTI